MRNSFVALIFLFLVIPSIAYGNQYLIQVDFRSAELKVLNDEGVIVALYPVALPKKIPKLPQKGQVLRVERNPYWAPTKLTRIAYFRKTGTELPPLVRSGDRRNAMGKVKIYIKWEGKNIDKNVRIHGTNEPRSIGRRVSRGCIRMRNEDIENLARIIDGKKTAVLFS